jgi:3-hydroxyacyl-[acyl-carrier-protein] dehydratase
MLSNRIVASNSPDVLLASIPQTAPFRFVDHVLEIDEHRVKAAYRFRGDEFFYAGHFRDDPITPGVILLEAMAQGGVVLHAAYLCAKGPDVPATGALRTMLTNAEFEIHRPVIPPQSVTICGELLTWRARRIRSKVQMFDEKNELLASATIAGIGVHIA